MAHGLSSRSPKRSFLAFSSSFEALPGAFTRFEGAVFIELLAVALDRGPVDSEASGGLAFSAHPA